ncbi:hypothetical protein [Kitasatospora azatica]|uniref:hypothetical protein n=1 Tax=Kitasatospora azatica TaxID=58347 RepID=UPI00055A734D|nr:hypothetical protein [Kitasatospora azatica]
MEPSSDASDAWAAAMAEEARELLTMLDGDPGLIDRDPVQALAWLEAELADVDTRDYTEDELRPFMSRVMSLLAEIIIRLHDAQWVTHPGAPPADLHVLAGGRLKAPVRIGPLVTRAFCQPRVSAVAMLNEAESEGRLRVF